jgi:hypothetical protein
MNCGTKPVTQMNEETQKQETSQAPAETTEQNQNVSSTSQDNKEVQSLLAQKEHFREKAEREAKEKAKLAAELENLKKFQQKTTLDVEDYIDISASLNGLDNREQERLAREHKLTGKPLKEIREDEDFKLWQTAYRAKVEKERALSPTSAQAVTDKPKSLAEKLATASLAEKEKLLSEIGAYKSPRPRADRIKLG